MRGLALGFWGAALLAGVVSGQTNSGAPALDAAKIAEYQQRFEQGYALEQAGKLAEARGVFDAILAEQPEAKRSLLEAGRVSLALNEPAKADAYLEKLHALVPDFPEAYELLIQANEALRKEIKVERLVREFRELRDSGRVEGFNAENNPRFVRQRFPLGQGAEIVVYQFFDFTAAPFYALEADEMGADHGRKRMLLLKYDPDATAALRQKDPAHAQAFFFIIAEPLFEGERMSRIDVYQEIFSVPEYAKARNTLLGIFDRTPKPIYSAPVSGEAGK